MTTFWMTGLPRVLQPFKERLIGLTIDPHRLHEIRREASPCRALTQKIERCQLEVRRAEGLFRHHGLIIADTSGNFSRRDRHHLAAETGKRREYLG